MINIKKEDLEKYYIDEKKSILEISRIYECNSNTIRSRLKKYEITIRPQGAFLVDDDGETLKSKYNRGEINAGKYVDILVKNRGYKDSNEYNNELAKKKGYKDRNQYNNKMRYIRGDGLSMSKNKKCSDYLGVYICENKEFLSKIINIVESMPNNNPGYDAVCMKNKKIDVKCSCLSDDNIWSFHIKKNKVPDYFLMISFDDRESLNIIHIWLLKSDVTIEKTSNYKSESFIINEKNTITISKGNRALRRWIKHEITDTYKLEEAQKLCDNFKSNNIMNDE